MKKYIVTFNDKHEMELYASSAHNAEQIAIGVCARTAEYGIADSFLMVSGTSPRYSRSVE